MKRRVKERREYNRRLAIEDAKHRCGVCKVALPFRVFLRWGDPKMYCSAECLAAAEAGR